MIRGVGIQRAPIARLHSPRRGRVLAPVGETGEHLPSSSESTRDSVNVMLDELQGCLENSYPVSIPRRWANDDGSQGIEVASVLFAESVGFDVILYPNGMLLLQLQKPTATVGAVQLVQSASMRSIHTFLLAVRRFDGVSLAPNSGGGYDLAYQSVGLFALSGEDRSAPSNMASMLVRILARVAFTSAVLRADGEGVWTTYEGEPTDDELIEETGELDYRTESVMGWIDTYCNQWESVPEMTIRAAMGDALFFAENSISMAEELATMREREAAESEDED